MKARHISALLFLAGCASVQPYAPSATTSGPQHHLERNYEIGKVQHVFVGQPLVKVRDYYEQQTQVAVLRANKTFRIVARPFGQLNVPEGSISRVVGTTARNGKTYRLVVLPDPAASALRLLLNDDGTFEGSGINEINTSTFQEYRPDPPDARLIGGTATTVDRTKGYINFELIYSGTTGDSIKVLYREYTPDDMARPAYMQNLVYSLASKHIRFRDIQLDVSNADNEQISYIVISDGM